jgi:caffeoyl-CoA O-methyltransferase
MSRRSLQVDDLLYQYLMDQSIREHPAQAALRAATAAHPHAGMQISPEQGQFMQLLARMVNARRAIEVGVFTGYSSLAVALALPEDGRLVACDVSEEWTAIARRYWKKAGVEKKIDLRLGPALVTLDGLIAAGESGLYDFAFIDADKGNYLGYYERCLKLVRTGGIIATDNTLWSGEVANPANKKPDTVSLREYNERLHRDERVDLALLAIGDGLTLARKR